MCVYFLVPSFWRREKRGCLPLLSLSYVSATTAMPVCVIVCETESELRKFISSKTFREISKLCMRVTEKVCERESSPLNVSVAPKNSPTSLTSSVTQNAKPSAPT